MPYIQEKNRLELDPCIEKLVSCLTKDNDNLSNVDMLNIAGDINYVFSRVLGGVMGQISYSKVAVITGVLENIKQEFYRRAASPYEDTKIVQNGDIKEYKTLKVK